MQTIDKILAARNLTEACKEVIRNKGAGGVDDMRVRDLKGYLDDHRHELILNQTGVKNRLLGINFL